MNTVGTNIFSHLTQAQRNRMIAALEKFIRNMSNIKKEIGRGQAGQEVKENINVTADLMP
jgi:hypothetical protein